MAHSLEMKRAQKDLSRLEEYERLLPRIEEPHIPQKISMAYTYDGSLPTLRFEEPHAPRPSSASQF